MRIASAAIPGLAARGRVNPFVMVVSDNDTKLSGRITEDAFSMAPTFASLKTLGWHVIDVPDGHDLQAVYRALEAGLEAARANPNQPVCLHVKTIKGYGVKATAESASGGHGFPLKDGEQAPEFLEEIYGGNPPAEFAAFESRMDDRAGDEQQRWKRQPGITDRGYGAPEPRNRP